MLFINPEILKSLSLSLSLFFFFFKKNTASITLVKSSFLLDTITKLYQGTVTGHVGNRKG